MEVKNGSLQYWLSSKYSRFPLPLLWEKGYPTPVCVEQWRKLLEAITKLQRHGPKSLLATLVAVEEKDLPAEAAKAATGKQKMSTVYETLGWHK